MTDHVHELLGTGKAREALSLCRHACEEPHASATDWELYGQASSETGDLAGARKALVRATQLDPDLASAQFALGKLLATSGEYPQATERLERALQLQPANAEIWLALGVTFGLVARYDKAEECCRRSLELRPGWAAAHFNLGNALQSRGELSDAEVEYKAALDSVPRMVEAWSMLAQIRFAMKNLEGAEAAANEVLKIWPATGEAHFLLGNIALARGDYNQALPCFSNAAALLPDSALAFMRQGEAFFGLDRFEEAAVSFEKARKLDPEAAHTHYMLGQCFEKRNMGSEAIRSYRQALALDPDHLQAHYCIAFIYAHLDRCDEAARHFAEVLRLNPEDDQARHLLAAQQGKTTSTAPPSYVATLFDGVADTFDKKLVGDLGYRTPELLFEIFSDKKKPRPASLDMIDLGCGTGLCAPLFRPFARSLHGIDLSPRMIEKAGELCLYDLLEVNDIVSRLRGDDAAWDLVIAADVLIYVGDLQDVFAACARALRPGGSFLFSVENGDDAESYVLRNTGRYAHASDYIEALATESGFSVSDRRTEILRKDKGGIDINGYLYLLQLGSKNRS